MNLRDLEYLVAVADHRHFRKAAEACFVSQPTLSTQIKKLEHELGVTLLERAPGHVMLTAAGEQVVDRARVMLREAGSILDIARRAGDPESATLRLGLFPTLAPYLLPHVVPALRQAFPKLELLLVEEKTEEVLARLRDGRLDAGILALPVHDDQLHQEYLFDEDFLLALPHGHPLTAAVVDGEVTMDDLHGESLLLLEDGHCLRDQALEVCQLAGAVERSGFRATSLETLRQMVAAGVGITLLPQLAVRPPVANSPGVTLLRFAEPVPHRSLAMF
ncbi:MAG TPA: LysR substrate-binding domain-containing protein, partial [Ilumatobacteraceae bacterium]|nr:LysR substrate-binding domain-containing protein [Ilumatobacteraceae bacterium]